MVVFGHHRSLIDCLGMALERKVSEGGEGRRGEGRGGEGRGGEGRGGEGRGGGGRASVVCDGTHTPFYRR